MLLHDCENANFAYGKLYNLLTPSQRSRLLKIGGAVWEARPALISGLTIDKDLNYDYQKQRP